MSNQVFDVLGTGVGTQLKKQPPANNKVFTGSMEWTDQKISEFSKHLNANRTPNQEGQATNTDGHSPNPRFKHEAMI
jgi:hypothetical protein